MNISILGAGQIGGSLGKIWAEKGHQVYFGVRDPEKYANAYISQTNYLPIHEAIDASDVILVAVPAVAAETIAREHQPRLAGKIIIDATNNIRDEVMHNLDIFRKYLPNAHLYRAFNHLGWENFVNPQINGEQIDLFFCGDEDPAKETVSQLIADIGLRPIDIGDINQAGLLDNLTRLWFTLAIQKGYGRHLAFKLQG